MGGNARASARHSFSLLRKYCLSWKQGICQFVEMLNREDLLYETYITLTYNDANVCIVKCVSVRTSVHSEIFVKKIWLSNSKA